MSKTEYYSLYQFGDILSIIYEKDVFIMYNKLDAELDTVGAVAAKGMTPNLNVTTDFTVSDDLTYDANALKRAAILPWLRRLLRWRLINRQTKRRFDAKYGLVIDILSVACCRHRAITNNICMQCWDDMRTIHSLKPCSELGFVVDEQLFSRYDFKPIDRTEPYQKRLLTSVVDEYIRSGEGDCIDFDHERRLVNWTHIEGRSYTEASLYTIVDEQHRSKFTSCGFVSAGNFSSLLGILPRINKTANTLVGKVNICYNMVKCRIENQGVVYYWSDSRTDEIISVHDPKEKFCVLKTVTHPLIQFQKYYREYVISDRVTLCNSREHKYLLVDKNWKDMIMEVSLTPIIELN